MDNNEQERRLAALRAVMKERELAAFLVPRADEHQGEYVPPSAERLAWISGFTGSAGMAVITPDRAVLFVDGRYTLQAEQQASSWEHRHLIKDTPEAWLAGVIERNDLVGFDPRLHTPEGLARIASAVERAGAVMKPLEESPIDRVWTNRPGPPMGMVELFPDSRAGESSAQKRNRMAEALRQQQMDALVISAPDSLAWLFNIRGADLAHTPFVLGFAILHSDGRAVLFVDPRKITPAVRENFNNQGEGAITVAEPAAFNDALSSLGGKTVRVDKATGSIDIIERLRSAGANVEVGDDPCTLPKACKTEAELAGMRAAHVRDGVALVRFMSWFVENAPGSETEWSLAKRLDALRAEGEHFHSLSFPTISAAGPSSALPHYRVEEDRSRALQNDEIYLVDSGAQYLDGTTDVTRTLIVGAPTREMIRRYTQVLKGHISIATARFPQGTTGAQIDALARQYLWQDGVDYDHGTGHGVGCFLSVHEGPQNISKRPVAAPLLPGMVLSDEPGYYKTGAFGIRIENLVAVTVLDPQPEGAECTTLGFETITLAPYDHRLIDVSLLTPSERDWVDAYHARVRKTLTPHLDQQDAAFLEKATAPLQTVNTNE